MVIFRVTEQNKIQCTVFQQFDNEYDEADYVVSDIKSHVREGERSYNEHAILYRTNAQSRIFEEKFIMANVPYKVIGGVNFYSRKEIKDLLAYLKTIDNGMDDLAVRRIINVPKRGIGLTTINRVQENATERGVSFYEALRTADMIPGIGKAATKLDSFMALMEHFKQSAKTKLVSELMQEILDFTGYIEELEEEGKEEAEARIENINELLSKIATYEESCEDQMPTLSGFLEEVALVADIDNFDDNSDYVVLMTLHSAKGLEFPEVYMVGMEDGIFPSYMTVSEGDLEELEEERRLCYVGITRAMENLTLTCARRRMLRGEVQYNKMSRFVREIPADLFGNKMKAATEEINTPKQNAYFQAKQAFKKEAFSAVKPTQNFGVKAGGGLDYEVGDRVKHMKFGEGLVTSIVEGGRDYEVTVQFDNAGPKKMFAGFAKLQKI